MTSQSIEQQNLNACLFEAASDFSTDGARNYIAKGASIVATHHSTGQSVLHFATQRYSDDATLLGFFIAVGANVDAKDRDGDTALHEAAKRGHLNMVKKLVESKADISVLNKDNKTALQLATEKGHSKVRKFLRDRFRTMTKIDAIDLHQMEITTTPSGVDEVTRDEVGVSQFIAYSPAVTSHVEALNSDLSTNHKRP